MTSGRGINLDSDSPRGPRSAAEARAGARQIVGARVRLAAHGVYFGFAIAALLALCLLVPRQTTRAPVILLAAFGIWAAAAGARLLWNRYDPVALALEPANLFIPIVAATYTVFAFDASPAVQGFSPSSPDSLPGLHIDQHVYFAMALIALSAFAGWYGVRKAHLPRTLLVCQVVLVSVMYERFLATPAAVPPLALVAAALVLLRLAPLRESARPIERSIAWLAAPMALLAVVALLATAVSAYPGASLAAAGKMLALAMLAIALFDTVRDERSRWLVWAAIVTPAVIEAALVTFKLLDIGRVMGLDYAFRNRVELAAGVEVNPLGLSLALGILLIAGAMPRFPSVWARLGGGAALALLLPALVVTYSVGALLGLFGGLVVLAIFDLSRERGGTLRGYARFAPVAMLAAVGLIVAAVYVLPGPPRDALRNTVDDPSTGRSRVRLWEWALRDFKANPVLGVGPTVYWPRVRYLPDFPYRDVTRIFERRRLLGHDTTQWRFLLVTHPHNLAVDIAEGAGVIGLLAFAAAAATAARAGVRSLRRRDRDDRWFGGLGVATLVAVVLFSTGSIGLQIALLPLPMWIAFGMVAIGNRDEADAAQFSAPGWLASRPAQAMAVVLSMAALAVFVVRPVGSLAAGARADARSAAGDAKGSAGALRVAAAFDPLDIGVRAALANIELRDGKAAEALAYLKEADARAPRYGPLLVQLGEISWLRGDTSAAERYLRDGVRNDSWQVLNADPYTPLGLLLLSRGDVEGAKAALAAGIRVSPVNVRDRAWVQAGGDVRIDRAYEAAGDSPANAGLREALERRMFISPGADKAGEAGDIKLTDVIAVLEQEGQRAVLARDPQRAAEILDQAGLAYQFAGLHTDAARVFNKAIEADPGASYVRYDLAQSEIALHDDGAASAQLEEVVRIARGTSTYDVRLGFAERDLALIAMRAQRYEDAVALMRSALRDYRWAYLPEAYSTLAAAYTKLGRPNEAATWKRREAYLQGRPGGP